MLQERISGKVVLRKRKKCVEFKDPSGSNKIRTVPIYNGITECKVGELITFILLHQGNGELAAVDLQRIDLPDTGAYITLPPTQCKGYTVRVTYKVISDSEIAYKRAALAKIFLKHLAQNK